MSLLLAACATVTAQETETSTVVAASLEVGSDGAAELVFDVPAQAVAITILARSDSPIALIQLAELAFDGFAPLSLATDPTIDPLAAMTQRFSDHEIIETPNGFVHEVQMGTYAFTYPFAPGWELPTGQASLSVLVSDGSRVDIEVRVVPDSIRPVLPVTYYEPGESRLSDEARMRVDDILGEAGVLVEWSKGSLPDGTISTIEDVEDRTPGSSMGGLIDGVTSVSTGGVNLVVVDGLGGGISGLSTGVPGPHDGTGLAVTVTFRSQTETARLVAHEIAHLLGLRHLEDRSANGLVVQNPILDTRADAYNLMQFGTNLTDGQVEILRLSPLLRPAG